MAGKYRDVRRPQGVGLPGSPSPIESNGPALGNVPTQDSYLRIKQNIEGLHAHINSLYLDSKLSKALTPDQLQQIQNALQAGGPNVLNLTALPGILLQPQAATIPEVTKLPTTGKDGQVLIYRKVIWRFYAKTHSWSPVSTILLLDYSYNLGNYLASSYSPGVLFLATNTGTLYVEQDLIIGGVSTPTWVPQLSETVVRAHADRYSTGTLNTTANNNGSPAVWASGEHFRSSMVGQQIWISGNLYPVASYSNNNSITLSANLGVLTGANYVFEYPSINYPEGGLFIETDRNVEYYVGNANGSVNVTGNNVAWVSGPKFNVYWKSIVINNNNFNIASSVVGGTSLVVTSPPGNANGIGYSVPRGAWFYATGMYTNGLASIPADLDVTDANYCFGSNDYNHSYIWNGTAWNFSPGDPGSAFIVGSVSPPLGGPWALCDGSTTVCATGNGSTTSVITANLTGDVFLKGGTPGNVQPANAATWDANSTTDSQNLNTANESSHTHALSGSGGLVVDSISFNPGNSNASLNFTTGSVVASIDPTTGPGSPHNHAINPNPHSHNLSNNNAKLNAPSENNGGLPLRIALSWYMRR